MVYHKSSLQDKNRNVLDDHRRLSLPSIDRSFVPQYNIEILGHDLDRQEECAICLEPFYQQDMVARLECLCIYHEHCLNRWTRQRHRSCPLHMDTSLAVHPQDLRLSSAHPQEQREE